MERIPESPPVILPVALQERPLWSVMIPVYNCAHYLPEALQGVLAQAPGEEQMQIEVVDDASTDADVAALVEHFGKGRVQYFRQAENVGCLRNFETCINRAKGRLVHLLHGDDRVEMGFYDKMDRLFQQYPQAGAAFCNYIFIDESGKEDHINPPEAEKEGILKDWLVRIAERQRIQYVAMVVRREVYEALGSFYGTTCGEDWEMWVRVARYYPVAYTPAVLAAYRDHLSSLTWKNAVSDKIFSDLLRVMELINEHVPEKDRKSVMVKSRRHCAHYLMGKANVIWEHSHDHSFTQTQIKQAITLSKDPSVLSRVLKLYLKITRDGLKKNTHTRSSNT